MVGERGASLSGGQRARISLARAVYKAASIYLFDDPLSAVDAHVGKHLFEEVISPKGHLGYGATRILITHQVHFLKEADIIIIVENGRITHKGTYKELSRSDIDFAKLLERTDDEEDHAKEMMVDDLFEPDEIILPDGAKVVKGYKPLKARTESIGQSVRPIHTFFSYVNYLQLMQTMYFLFIIDEFSSINGCSSSTTRSRRIG